MENIVASMAQFDNNLHFECTVVGMKVRLERGGWTSPPPLGYLKGIDANGTKTIIPDPQRRLITQAFEMYATGLYAKQQVLDAITHLGLTTKSGKRLSAQTFYQTLRKPYSRVGCWPAQQRRSTGEPRNLR
jgi:DNA invertase Pin-like site-specific DNA recombinase